MTSTTFNTLLTTVLASVTPNVIPLFTKARASKKKYIELDPSRDRSVPHRDYAGSQVYTDYFGIIIIKASNLTDMLAYYDEVITALQSYGFEELDFEDEEKKGYYRREISLKVISS